MITKTKLEPTTPEGRAGLCWACEEREPMVLLRVRQGGDWVEFYRLCQDCADEWLQHEDRCVYCATGVVWIGPAELKPDGCTSR